MPTRYPADFQLPMVAPHHIGALAAQLLAAPAASPGLHYAEGPRTCSPADVAAVFAAALRHPVAVAVTPRPQWQSALQAQGFPEPAAQSFARLMARPLDHPDRPPHPPRGSTTLEAYVQALVTQAPSA